MRVARGGLDGKVNKVRARPIRLGSISILKESGGVFDDRWGPLLYWTDSSSQQLAEEEGMHCTVLERYRRGGEGEVGNRRCRDGAAKCIR